MDEEADSCSGSKWQLVEVDKGLLPPEVWSLILSFIEDWGNLKACRLTCRTFFTLCDYQLPAALRQKIIVEKLKAHPEWRELRFAHSFEDDLILYYLYADKKYFRALLQSEPLSTKALELLFFRFRQRRSWFAHEHNNLGILLQLSPFADKRAFQLLRLIAGCHESRSIDSHLLLRRVLKAYSLDKKKIVTECMIHYPIYFCGRLSESQDQQWQVLYKYVMGTADSMADTWVLVCGCFYRGNEEQTDSEILQIEEAVLEKWKLTRLLHFLRTRHERTSRHFELFCQIVEVIKAYV